MPIQAKCPGCGTVYMLVDEQRGLRVRCRNCVETFIVGAEVAAPAAAVPPSPPPTLMPPPAQVTATATPPVARETMKPVAALFSLPSPLEGEGSGERRTPEPGQGSSTMGPAAAGPRTLPKQFGRYRIVKKLGAGGMGTVFLAHDSQLDRSVALKVPHFNPKDDQVRQRFYREAKAAATLAHPNLCPVYDVGEIDGVLYLTMGYIEGKPLSAFLRDGKALPQRGAALLVHKLAGALQEAHQRGVIHRDLKPSNVMINQRREPVIMDFGLARRSAGDARVTRSGLIVGTPAYMSPEQASGDSLAICPASDVYSLGVILYEMLAGKLPFDGPVAAILGQIMVQPPEPPSRHTPDCDPALETICLKAMAKKIEDRYATMSEFRDALGAYLRSSVPSAAPALLDLPPPSLVGDVPVKPPVASEADVPPQRATDNTPWWSMSLPPEPQASEKNLSPLLGRVVPRAKPGEPAHVEPLLSVPGGIPSAVPVPLPVAQVSSWKESHP